MKQFATTLSFVLLCFFVFPQTNIDSLKGVMSSSNSYKEKIKAYLAYVEALELKKFDSAMAAAGEAVKLARENGDSITVAILKRHTGIINYFGGKYDLAAKDYYASISILEKTNQKRQLAYTYNELAKLYRKTKDLDRSLENYDKAMAIFRELNDAAGTAMILNESGVVFEYKKDYAEALDRYNASLKIARSLNDAVAISYALNFIAGVQTIQGKFDDAEKNLLQALEIRRNLKDSFMLALTYTDLGATLNAKGDGAKAAGYLDASNQIASQIHYPELISNNYAELASIAQKQGDYQKALDYSQKRTAIRDSLFSIEKTRQIEELNAKYESVKKEQEIQKQRFRITRQNFLIAGIVILLGLGSMLGASQYKRYKLKQEAKLKTALMKQQEIATRAVIEAEEKERQRIAKDLHDGIGQMMSAAKMNLSAFESDIRFNAHDQKQALEKIIQLVDESCKELRNVSHNMMPNALLKNSLAEAIREFVNKLDQKKLQVHLYTEGLDEKLDSNIETVLYRVIQECVNNVIKHSDATELDISLVKDEDGISATIDDNGKGFDAAARENYEGMGLKNIITRVEFLKGTVDFDSTPGKGTLVALYIPVKQLTIL
jgi:two-component system, NarL family, sensor kinase